MSNGYKLPPPATLAGLTQSQKQQILTHLFEPSNALFKHLVPIFNKGKYASYNEFVESCRNTLLALVPTDTPSPLSSCDPDLLEIVSTHPRLGVPKTAVLSDHSASEQKTLQTDESVVKEFALLNREYEETFPGLRFVLFVNGRSKTEVQAAFKQRISRGSYLAELEDALNAMCDIAIDRSGKLSSNL